MKLINKTKKTVISQNAAFLKTEKERVIGLIGSKNPRTIHFETRFGIHTFFLQFPIDVVILNEQKEVVALKENLQPNRILLWNPKYKIVIESPTGTITKSKTKVGDLLFFEQREK